jgi:hypothetical protein
LNLEVLSPFLQQALGNRCRRGAEPRSGRIPLLTTLLRRLPPRISLKGGMLLSVAGVLLVSGCGASGRATVQGQVTLDGQPLEQGAINFVPSGATKAPLTGAVITNGRYLIAAQGGPLAGTYKVEIRSAKKTGKKMPEPPPAPAGTMRDVLAEGIPTIYNEESILTAALKAGSNEFDFHLKSKVD